MRLEVGHGNRVLIAMRWRSLCAVHVLCPINQVHSRVVRSERESDQSRVSADLHYGLPVQPPTKMAVIFFLLLFSSRLPNTELHTCLFLFLLQLRLSAVTLPRVMQRDDRPTSYH